MKEIIVLGEGKIFEKCVELLKNKYGKNNWHARNEPIYGSFFYFFETKGKYLIFVQYPSIIPSWGIQQFSNSAFNLHNADTQHYRGCHCIDWEIYNKESEHAVTIHRMTKKPDLGPIAFQEWIPIEKNDTPRSLWQKSVPAAVSLFGRLLDYIVEDKEIPKIEVDPKIGKFYKRGEKPT